LGGHGGDGSCRGSDAGQPVHLKSGTMSLHARYGRMRRFFNLCATKISTAAGQPMTFITAVAIIVIWAVSGPLFHYSDTWQLIINTGTTIVTFLMVFLIQNSQNRDAAAMQAKLDELLRAVDKAREKFIGIEHLTDQQIELVRSALERYAKDAEGKDETTEDTVDRLLKRF
jgi:low affinity Fe/Cu permease